MQGKVREERGCVDRGYRLYSFPKADLWYAHDSQLESPHLQCVHKAIHFFFFFFAKFTQLNYFCDNWLKQLTLQILIFILFFILLVFGSGRAAVIFFLKQKCIQLRFNGMYLCYLQSSVHSCAIKLSCCGIASRNTALRDKSTGIVTAWYRTRRLRNVVVEEK